MSDNKITAKQVKELRDKTGVGIMDAKKALVASNGDIKQAIDKLREKGIAKASKKSNNIAAEGLAYISINGNTASIVEVNSETDFVSSNDKFKNLVKNIADTISKNKPKSIDEALKLPMNNGTISSTITALTAVIGEKISLRRFKVIEKNDKEYFGKYLHNGGQIAALVVVSGSNETVAKDVAMHVAAVNPKYLSPNDIPNDVVQHEKEVLTKETKNEGKPENIIDKIVKGRLEKFFAEMCLVNQSFVKQPDETVKNYVESNHGEIKTFIRYEVGEGIEKKQEDFAESVAKEINNAK